MAFPGVPSYSFCSFSIPSRRSPAPGVGCSDPAARSSRRHIGGGSSGRELAEVSRRADNPALLGSLPDFGVNAATILHDLDAGRADR